MFLENLVTLHVFGGQHTPRGFRYKNLYPAPVLTELAFDCGVFTLQGFT